MKSAKIIMTVEMNEAQTIATIKAFKPNNKTEESK